MKWINKTEISNEKVMFGMLLSFFGGFTFAYLHWGKGVPWI